MNMLLIHPEDLDRDGIAVIRGRRHNHIREVLKSKPGDTLRIGRLNGPFGCGQIISIEGNETRLALDFENTPYELPRVSVVLAMVRPRIARQTLIALASLGVKRIMFINARRVAKPYFSQRLFDADQYKEFLYLGLEQGIETCLPEVTIHKQFKVFVEQEMEELIDRHSHRYIAHPESDSACRGDLTDLPEPKKEVVLAIGPEGGWVDYEVERLCEHGFKPLSLGKHILRVETALPYAFGKLQLG